jgi:hypothetical protein
MNEFYEATGIERPPAATIESWFSHVEKVELQTLAAVLDKMKTELGRRPYNMLFKLKEFIRIYYADHPDARPKPVDEPCDDCNGEGFFFVKYDHNGTGDKKQSAIVLCGSCENWRKTYGTTRGFLRLKKFEAEYQGFEIQK